MCGLLLVILGVLTACGSAETNARGGEKSGVAAIDNANANAAVSAPPTSTPPVKKQDDAPKFEKGENYKSVREKLLKAGWQPFKSADAQPCSGDDPRCKNYPEMESCAGTGLGNCRYLWKREAKTLVIFTIGEDPVYDGQEFEKPKAPAKSTGAAGTYVYSYKHDSGADTFVYELKANGVATYKSEREGGDGEDLTGTWDESEGVVTIAFKNEAGKNDFIDFALENGNLRQLTDPRTKGQDRGVRGFVGTVFKKQR